MSNKLLFRLAVLVAAIMCALGASAQEAYACYTPSNTTLTFYYDNQRSSRPGTTYDLNTGTNDTGWETDGTNASVTNVVFDPSFADARPTTTYAWFYKMENLQSITGISYLNTSEVTNMAYMFNICRGLTSLDVSNFNTTKVTSMKAMFQDCKSLTSLDLRSFNTAKVTNMTAMFNLCNFLATIYVGENWTTAAVTGSTEMFYNCYNIEGGQGTTFNGDFVDKTYAHIDGGPSNPGYFTDHNASALTIAYACYTQSNTTLTFYYDDQRSSRPGTTYGLNTGNNDPGWARDGTSANVTTVVFDPSFANARPTTTCAWFFDMQNLQSITGISYLNTSEVTNMECMFQGCQALTSLDLSGFDTRNVTNMWAMFSNCNMTSLNLTSFNTAKVTNMTAMFYLCNFLAIIYVGENWSTAAVTESTGMFNSCPSLVGGMGTTYDPNHVDKTYAHIDGGPSNPGYLTAEGTEAYACYTSSNTTLTFYYDNQRSSRTGTTYDLNTGNNKPDWYTDNTYRNVSTVVFDPLFAIARPTSTYWWFSNMGNLSSIEGIEYLNTSEVTNMSRMFSTCWSMESFDLSHFDTGNVRDMSFMFNYCEALTSLDLSSFDTHNVLDMEGMFYECSSLTSLDLSSFNTENVHNFQEMFNDCAGLTSMDLRHFDTRNAESMNGMFLDCSGLTSIDLSSFNTEHVVDMSNMFSYCSGLTSLDLSSFNTSYLLLTNWMFSNCRNLVTVNVGDEWNANSLDDSEGMFQGCTSLVGGMGTTYDANHVDAEYAHIDRGPSDPGYFTSTPKPYACYTPSNTTLTFYYDDQRSSRPGTTYDLNTGTTDAAWDTDGTNASVTKVVFDASFAGARPTTTYDWFYGMGKLRSITGMSYLNTSEVTNMGWMFGYCVSLTSLDVSHFNTSQVTIMDGMFQQCSSLTNLDLSSFNTSKVTYMRYMFTSCQSLTSLDLSSFNTSKVAYMRYMFNSSYNLQTIYVGDGWSTAAVTESINMFNGCTSLVGGQGTTYNSSHIDKAYAHIDGGPSNPGYFTEWKEAYACYTPSNTTLTFYCDKQRSSRPGTTYDMNTGSNYPGWTSDGTNADVTKVVFDPSFADALTTTTYGWFYRMQNLKSVEGIEYLNTSEVTNMAYMFMGCSKLTSLDLNSFNTANVTRMPSMFSRCSGLTSLDLSSFNTANVETMEYMFNDCINLTTIYVGNEWSTTAVTESADMFYDCTSLVGGQGTSYNASHTDAEYAHLDGGTSNPGYFSEKGGTFLRGDVNGDGQVKIGDVTILISYLLSGDTSGINLQAADCDQNGEIKIGDVTVLINYLLSGTWN